LIKIAKTFSPDDAAQKMPNITTGIPIKSVERLASAA
jgi:hypothetical protein